MDGEKRVSGVIYSDKMVRDCGLYNTLVGKWRMVCHLVDLGREKLKLKMGSLSAEEN